MEFYGVFRSVNLIKTEWFQRFTLLKISKFHLILWCRNFVAKTKYLPFMALFSSLDSLIYVKQEHFQSTELTLSQPISLSYRNQSIDLQNKSIVWFLYERDIGR